MSEVFFIADTHFGHRNICKYRTVFNNPFEHDEYIIEKWNKTIGRRDTIWVLGDMCIKNEEYNMEYLIDRLNGRINVVPGNHCYLPYYNHRNIELQNGLVSKYGLWLSHCPIHPNELRGRKYNVHGHVHNETINDNRYVNVCCEVVGYKPVSLDKIRKVL